LNCVSFVIVIVIIIFEFVVLGKLQTQAGTTVQLGLLKETETNRQECGKN